MNLAKRSHVDIPAHDDIELYTIYLKKKEQGRHNGGEH